MWEVHVARNKYILFRAHEVQCTRVSAYRKGEGRFGADKHQ